MNWAFRGCRTLPGRVGTADRSFPGNPGKPKTPGASIYGSRGRVLFGGSRWQSALPTGSKWVQAQPAGSRWVSAAPTRVFRGIPENQRPWELQSMAPGVVCYSAAASGSGPCPVSRACRPRRGRRSRRAPDPRCSHRPGGCSTRSRRRARRGPRGRWRARWWRSGAACRPAWGS